MDSDEEREEEIVSWKGIPATIILINVFDVSNTNTPVVAHAATCRMVKQYLRASNSYNVGVCLYGTEESSSSSILDTKNIIEVFQLCAPTLDDFKKLQSLDMSTIRKAKEFELSGVLWHCSKMFANCKKVLSTRTVVLLTRLDTPPIQADQKPAFKRVVDLVESNVDVKIINIAQDDYKVDPFFENFLIEANKGKEFVVPKPLWDPVEIDKVMHQQSHRHLAVARLSFEIGEGISIGVGVYNLLIKSGQYQHKKVNLDRETNAIVTSVTKTVKVSNEQDDSPMPGTSAMDVDETEPKHLPILKSELLHYIEYGGVKVQFSDNEKKKLQNPFGPPTMKLLGFKPASLLCKEKWYLKNGAFLFPCDNIIEGSTVAFKALHEACSELSTVAICILTTRINSRPNIVALSPCTHPLGLSVEMGFDIIHIPFEENVRDLSSIDPDVEISVTNEQKSLMKTILKTVKFDYKPDMFENPKTQSEFRAIEAIALEEDELEPFVDTTKPSSSKFSAIPANRFEELFGPFGPVAPKRPAASKDCMSNSKKTKTDIDIDETLFRSRLKSSTLHQYNVAQLKEILRRKYDPKMPALTGLKKNNLLDLVYKYYKESD